MSVARDAYGDRMNYGRQISTNFRSCIKYTRTFIEELCRSRQDLVLVDGGT